jgi:hypothetical protein
MHQLGAQQAHQEAADEACRDQHEGDGHAAATFEVAHTMALGHPISHGCCHHGGDDPGEQGHQKCDLPGHGVVCDGEVRELHLTEGHFR